MSSRSNSRPVTAYPLATGVTTWWMVTGSSSWFTRSATIVVPSADQPSSNGLVTRSTVAHPWATVQSAPNIDGWSRSCGCISARSALESPRCQARVSRSVIVETSPAPVPATRGVASEPISTVSTRFSPVNVSRKEIAPRSGVVVETATRGWLVPLASA